MITDKACLILENLQVDKWDEIDVSSTASKNSNKQ